MLDIQTGTRFSKLVVIREGKRLRLPSGQTNRTIRCKCDCGNVKNIRLLHLVRGRIRSCGCLGGDQHGGSNSKLYRVWNGMKERCYRDGHINGHRYKGRGIVVCNEWLNSFRTFRDWAYTNSYSPGLYIDRINNDGNYEPTNCRFVTNQENCNNTSTTLFVTYNKQKIALRLILKKLGMANNYKTIYDRIKRGWKEQKAIDTPIRKGNYKRSKAA